MREIKFRYYDLDQKIMHYSNDLISFFEDYAGYEYPLMQYTGLKDKNGKEIYEGDIIKWCQEILVDMGEKIDIHEGTAKIYWDKVFAHFGLEAIPKTIGHYMFCEDMKHTIIGNIYENPELLK